MMDSNFSKKIVFPKIKVQLPNNTDRHNLNRDAFSTVSTPANSRRLSLDGVDEIIFA